MIQYNLFSFAVPGPGPLTMLVPKMAGKDPPFSAFSMGFPEIPYKNELPFPIKWERACSLDILSSGGGLIPWRRRRGPDGDHHANLRAGDAMSASFVHYHFLPMNKYNIVPSPRVCANKLKQYNRDTIQKCTHFLKKMGTRMQHLNIAGALFHEGDFHFGGKWANKPRSRLAGIQEVVLEWNTFSNKVSIGTAVSRVMNFPLPVGPTQLQNGLPCAQCL